LEKVKDRISAGFFSGIIAGLAMNMVDWLGYILNFYDERLLNWASIITLGRLPNTLGETIFAQIEQIFFSGFLGIPLAYILLKITSGNLLLKGWIYGVLANEAIYAIAIALRLPGLETHSFNATISHAISASVYGLVLAYVLKRLDKVGTNG
jgi:hypothetical protein